MKRHVKLLLQLFRAERAEGLGCGVIHIYGSTLGARGSTSCTKEALAEAQPIPTWGADPGPVVMQERAGSDPTFHSLSCFVLL